jgi:hypothetical protein
MKTRHTFAACAAFGILALVSLDASAVACAAGVYRAGCVGPNGAVAVRKPVPVYHPPVHCAAGVYRAGCVGPNGAAVIRR